MRLRAILFSVPLLASLTAVALCAVEHLPSVGESFEPPLIATVQSLYAEQRLSIPFFTVRRSPTVCNCSQKGSSLVSQLSGFTDRSDVLHARRAVSGRRHRTPRIVNRSASAQPSEPNCWRPEPGHRPR